MQKNLPFSGTSNAVTGEVVNRYNFFLNSHRAEIFNYETPSCEFLLNQQLTLSEPSTQFEIYIPTVMIPYTFYQFSSSRQSNFLTYTITIGGTGTYTVTIPEGNYNILQLASAFTSALQLQLVSLGFPNAVVTSQYKSTTNRVRFNIVNSAPLRLEFITTRLGVAFGFLSPWSLDTTVTWSTGVADCNIAPVNMLFITSNTLAGSDSYEQLRSTNTSTLIIASLPIQHSPKYYLPIEFNNPLRTRITNSTLSSIDFNIIDNFGDQLQNFPVAWSFVLIVEEIRINTPFGVNAVDPSHSLQLPVQAADGILEEIDPIERNIQSLEQQALDKIGEIEQEIRESNIKKRKNV